MRLPMKEVVGSSQHMKAMFSGMTTNLIGLPCGFIYFLAYDMGNFLFEPFFEKYGSSSICHFLTGGFAEVSTLLLRNPFEVIKQQMQCGLDNEVVSTFKSIYKIRGFHGIVDLKRFLCRVLELCFEGDAVRSNPDASLRINEEVYS